MGNLSGVVAIFSVLFRPSLVIPHIQVPDIRYLDWAALHSHGVRYLVFDKDNCLTKPRSDSLEPALSESWEECQRVFGRENILIVSNSAGSSDDPSGLGAESLSRALNVPVLCHAQKKPSKKCAIEAMQYFVALNIDKKGTLDESMKMPPTIHATPDAGPSNLTKSQKKERIKAIRSRVPAEEDGMGSILLVGDRTMTDVIVAHRMNDELARRKKKYGTAQTPSPSASMPDQQCISVLTTSLWANEGRFNMYMRKLESRFMTHFIKRGLHPGQGGLWSRAANDRALFDWQSNTLVKQDPSKLEAKISETSRREDQLGEFAYTGEKMPPPQPQSLYQPTLGTLVLTTVLRPFPPQLRNLFSAIFGSRPVLWITSNFQQGWVTMMKGLEFGLAQAGIMGAFRVKKRDGTLEWNSTEDIAPPKRRASTQPASSVSLVENLLESRLPNLPSSTDASAGLNLLRSRWNAVGGGALLQRMTSSGHPNASHSQQQQRSLSTISSRLPHSRAFSTSALVLNHSSSGSNSTRPSSAAKPKGKIPMRNWIAAFSALAIVPGSYYLGIRLHEWRQTSEADKVVDLDHLPPTPSVPEPELHQPRQPSSSSKPDADQIWKDNQAQRRKELQLTLFHLTQERQDVVDKIERVKARKMQT